MRQQLKRNMLGQSVNMGHTSIDASSVAVALFVFMGKTSIAAYNVKVIVFVCTEDEKINARIVMVLLFANIIS